MADRRRPALTVARSDVAPIAPPASGRGQLWYDFQIADEFFAGLKGIKNPLRWVREHLPRAKRIKIGGSSAWYERDILDYIDSMREAERLRAEHREATA